MNHSKDIRRLEQEYIEQFNGHAVPEALLSLLQFANEKSKMDCFSDGFEFSINLDKCGLKTYSEDEEFLSSIIEFANADGTGSTYGFWLNNKDKNLIEAPVVIFGSEGDFHVVANNINDLLQILTFDSEPMVDWDSLYYGSEYFILKRLKQIPLPPLYFRWLSKCSRVVLSKRSKVSL